LQQEQANMKSVKTYTTTVEADLAKIALDAAGVPSVVVGVGAAMEGGVAGVQLLVPDECVEAALRALENS
jgi:phage-related minor tail protein